MPSLWKKHTGNRISRLVADLQTPPKRCGSLVVETGFPTSLVDLFVKNCDKLKKPKSQKHKSKKKTAIVDGEHQKFSTLPSVSGSSASNSEFDSSSCSNVENFQENDAQIVKNGSFVEVHHDSCRIGSNVEKKGFFEVTNSNCMVLLSILMGLIVFVVALYTKRWFLLLISLGFMLLMLLEYVGKPCFWFLKPCENIVSMSILKGAMVVGVAMDTKWLVVGITIGASLLLLLEYVGKSVCGFFKPCQVVTWKWLCILSHWGLSKRRGFEGRSGRKRRRAVLTRSLLISSKRSVRKDCEKYVFSSTDFDQERVKIEDVSREEYKPEFGSGLTLNRDHEVSSEGDRESVSSKREIEQGSGHSSVVNENSLLLEVVTQDKPMYEMLDLELKNLKLPMNETFSGPVRYVDLLGDKGAIKGRKEGCEDSEMSDSIDYNAKCKRNKKFWKKLVPKKIHRKKKHKHERGHSAANADDIQYTETDLKEDDGQEENKQETSKVEGSKTLSLVEEDKCEIANYDAANTFTEMLQLDSRTIKPCEMVKVRAGNLKYLTTLMIPLTGLIGGRMFAVVITVICCLVFKIVRG